MPMLLALAGCVSTTISADTSSCSDLLDGTWEDPVPDAAAPREGASVLDTLKSWIGFGVAQTANKQTEFERAQAARQIIKRCEERNREAVKNARRKLLGVF